MYVPPDRYYYIKAYDQMEGRRVRGMDGQRDGWTDKWTDGQTQTDRQTDGRIKKWMDGQKILFRSTGPEREKLVRIELF